MAGGKVSTKGEEKYKKLQNYEKGMKIPKLNTKYKTIVGLLSALQYLSPEYVHVHFFFVVCIIHLFMFDFQLQLITHSK